MRNIKDLFQDKKRSEEEVVSITPDEKSIFFLFRKVFGELYGVKGNENITPVQVQGKKLFLKPRTSLWANEALLQRQLLIGKINTTLGEEYLEDIIITQRSEESFRS